ncbi:Alanine racemase [plant metagenome]
MVPSPSVGSSSTPQPAIASSSAAPPPPPPVVASAPSSSQHLGLLKGRAAKGAQPNRPLGKPLPVAESAGTSKPPVFARANLTRAKFWAKDSPIYAKIMTALNEPRIEASFAATLQVKLGNIRKNYRKGADKLGAHVEAAAVIKADAYGLGATTVAKALMQEGCRTFFVARTTEAIKLRSELRDEDHPLADTVKIHVLDGLLAHVEPRVLVEYDISPVLNSPAQAKRWSDHAANSPTGKLPCILQFDTGMNRAGMTEAEAETMIAQLRGTAGPDAAGSLEQERYAGLEVTHIMTHLAKAGEAAPRPGEGNDATRQAGETSQAQLARFETLCQHFPQAKHSIGASSTVFLEPAFHKDMVRMGGTFHGQAPFEADTNPLLPTITLVTSLSKIHLLKAGEGTGYGLRFTAHQDMPVATIPLGYADGLPRRAHGNAPADAGQPEAFVLVEGRYRAPFVGATSMDMSTIDLSAVPKAFHHEGARVTVIGPHEAGGQGITPDHFGDSEGTNASELQTKITSRVRKTYTDQA